MAKGAENKIKKVFDKLKKKEILLAVAVVMVMLIIYFSTTNDGNEKVDTVEQAKYDYCVSIENKTEEAIIEISGDKNAKVVIAWKNSVEEVIAYSTSTSGNTTTSTPVIIQTSGESGPIVLKQIYPEVVGIVVVFSGAKDTRKKIETIEMVSTLLGISPEKVAVYESK